ncbi:MAG: glycosyltransferase family 2 protein, partial [Betaproteobacteria bacterium]|nr:glycosyltransferase family 2 protein [Betaproteobacteria bacterium]
MTEVLPSLRLAVIVPSFRRPEGLARCLESLERQTRRPDDVVIGVREHDAPTLTV